MPPNLTTGLVSLPPLTSGVSKSTLMARSINSLVDAFSGRTLTNMTVKGTFTVTGTMTATNAIITGVIYATSGAIGGFDIGADYIRDAANSMGLASTVTAGDDVRGWAGATFANRATAPLRWTEAGALVATSATITGAITATSGTIGGFTVTANELYAGTGATRVEMQAAGGFWAGATAFADAPFSVTPAGVFKATSATITGAINATSGYFGSAANGVNVDATGVTLAGTGHISTGTSGARVEMLATGVKWYDATTQRGEILATGAGWMGSSTAFAWTAAGAVTMGAGAVIGGWTLGATTLTSTGVILTSTGGIQVVPSVNGGDLGYLRFKHASDSYPMGTIYADRDVIDSGLNDQLMVAFLNRATGAIYSSSLYYLGGITLSAAHPTFTTVSAGIYGASGYGVMYTTGRFYPGSGTAAQSTRYISDDATYTFVSGGLKLGASLYPGNQTTYYISGTTSGIGINVAASSYALEVQAAGTEGNKYVAMLRGTATYLAAKELACGTDANRAGLSLSINGGGEYRLWVDDAGKLRINSTDPTSNTDGTVVGAQTA